MDARQQFTSPERDHFQLRQAKNTMIVVMSLITYVYGYIHSRFLTKRVPIDLLYHCRGGLRKAVTGPNAIRFRVESSIIFPMHSFYNDFIS